MAMLLEATTVLPVAGTMALLIAGGNPGWAWEEPS